jgi:hypothetical protein
VGYGDVDDALRRLDKATQEEALTVAAQALDVAHCVHDGMQGVRDRQQDFDDTVKRIENRVKGLEEGKMNSLHDVLDSEQPDSSSL